MNDNLRVALINELKKDEHEYCFDKSYCDDKTWERENNESREQAYNRAISHWVNISSDVFIAEIQKCFGDKYDYIINHYDSKA